MPLDSEFSFWQTLPFSFEDPNAPGLSQEATYRREARNLLKHFIAGVPIFNENSTHPFFPTSPLLKDGFKRSVYDRLFSKRDPHLLKALREEIQALMLNNFTRLSTCSLKGKARYEHFQNTFLSLYGFLEPQEGEIIQWTQSVLSKEDKADLDFKLIEYRFGKIDISPKEGPLSWVLEEEDRIYAYTLTPTDTSLPLCAHLIFMGTTYPVAQGGGLSQLYNLYPKHSIGEGHDLTGVKEWITAQRDKSVKVCGHSKGATMAQIAAAKWPYKIEQANAWAPAALASDTLKRLGPIWNKVPLEKRPVINVFSTYGDPVYKLDKGFLEGTHIFRITNEAAPSLNHRLVPTWSAKAYEAHIAYSLLRDTVIVKELTPLEIWQEHHSTLRLFLHDVKYSFNFVSFAFNYYSLFFNILNRKLKRWSHQYSPLLSFGLFLLTLPFNIAKVFISYTLQLAAMAASCMVVGVKIGLVSGYRRANPLRPCDAAPLKIPNPCMSLCEKREIKTKRFKKKSEPPSSEPEPVKRKTLRLSSIR